MVADILLWGPAFERYIREQMVSDPAHDLDHVRRVVRWALRLTRAESARPEITFPAAWLHDCVTVPKDSPDRNRASLLAADRAVDFLRGVGYGEAHLPEIAHAIAAHSFSAKLSPPTIEAAIVQDADRLDALGAIGIARCMMVGGKLSMPLYSTPDPFCRLREPDDRSWTVDHFCTKLLGLADSMNTDSGRQEARTRSDFMVEYLSQLESEISFDEPA